MCYLEQEEHVEQLKQETIRRWQEAESGKVINNQFVMSWLNTWGTEQESDRLLCES